MERYVNGFLLPIAKDNIGKYKEIAAKSGEVWKEHGALEYYECSPTTWTTRTWSPSGRLWVLLKTRR